jgi:hypothetical protein
MTLDGLLKAILKDNIAKSIGNGCNVGFKITAYDPANKTGTIAFADMSKFKDYGTVFSNGNIDKGNYSETKSFIVNTIANQNLMRFQVPLTCPKNNLDSYSQATLYV